MTSPIGIDQPCRILVVEDDFDSSRWLKRLLDIAGHSVDIAASCSEAMKLAKVRVYHLLLTDIDLPDGSGMALLKELRQLYPLKSIALTGMAAELDRAAIVGAGFDRYFAKPVDWRKIEKAMSELLPAYPHCN